MLYDLKLLMREYTQRFNTRKYTDTAIRNSYRFYCITVPIILGLSFAIV